MAKVLLLTVSKENPRNLDFDRGAYNRLKQSAGMGKSHHTLVENPVEADLILIAEVHIYFFEKPLRHDYCRFFPNKCFAFAFDDELIPFLPGVYASIEKNWYSPRRVRSGFYLSALQNPYTEFDPAPERDLLYSFVGSVNTAPVRAELAKLRHSRSVFIDTSKESLPIQVGGTPEQRAVFWKKYADIARRSKFVLCPRGIGTSSMRLFEMMQMGRAPVILADAWVPPEGPKWEEFSIRVPESEALNVPQLLEEREGEAVALGLKARREWERWFAPEAIFNTVVDWCLEIKEARRFPERLARLTVYPQMLRWPLFRAYLRTWKAALKGEGSSHE
ncbi:MAG: glycosyltransferase family 47 protein [Methylacidiphilales bacterium]|nr:glycosyltransferase family 47 protein [Candidatus Methylacidiphilales bacterium]